MAVERILVSPVRETGEEAHDASEDVLTSRHVAPQRGGVPDDNRCGPGTRRRPWRRRPWGRRPRRRLPRRWPIRRFPRRLSWWLLARRLWTRLRLPPLLRWLLPVLRLLPVLWRVQLLPVLL